MTSIVATSQPIYVIIKSVGVFLVVSVDSGDELSVIAQCGSKTCNVLANVFVEISKVSYSRIPATLFPPLMALRT
jgi:hypothetical protein